MKKLFLILLILGTGVAAKAQTLVFSKVIDTVLVASFSNCQDLTTDFVGGSITVPAGKVWKIEAIGPLNAQGSTTLYNNCNYQSYSNYRAFWGIAINDGQQQKGYLKRRQYNSSTGNYSDEALNGTAWVPAGTSLQAVMGTTHTSYPFAPSGPYSLEVFLPIIEFTVQP